MITIRTKTSSEKAAEAEALRARVEGRDLPLPARIQPLDPRVAQLASDMVDAAAGPAGFCTEDDLIARGWTPRALALHAEAARQLARVRTGGLA